MFLLKTKRSRSRVFHRTSPRILYCWRFVQWCTVILCHKERGAHSSLMGSGKVLARMLLAKNFDTWPTQTGGRQSIDTIVLGSWQTDNFGRGERTPAPTLSALLRVWPVWLRADFVLTNHPRPLYCKTLPCPFYHEIALRQASLDP